MEKKSFLQTDRRKIRKHWSKTDSEVEEHIADLKEWIMTKNFPEMPILDDQMIEFFLTNCKYNIEKTKINIETYYSIRKIMPDIYGYSNPKLPEIEEAWDMGCYLPLPKADQDLYRISFVRLGDSTKFNAYRYFGNMMNVYEIRVCEDLVVSEICIVDYKSLKWGHLFHFSPFLIRKMVFIMENVAKSRIKQIHVIHSSSYLNVLINITKKMFKKKMADRIQVHKNIETLYDYVPRELLPSDYGGKQPPISELTDMWKKKVGDYQDRFDMWDNTLAQEEENSD